MYRQAEFLSFSKWQHWLKKKQFLLFVMNLDWWQWIRLSSIEFNEERKSLIHNSEIQIIWKHAFLDWVLWLMWITWLKSQIQSVWTKKALDLIERTLRYDYDRIEWSSLSSFWILVFFQKIIVSTTSDKLFSSAFETKIIWKKEL